MLRSTLNGLRLYKNTIHRLLSFSSYKEPDSNDVSVFRDILGSNSVLTEDISSYNEDWLHIHKGN